MLHNKLLPKNGLLKVYLLPNVVLLCAFWSFSVRIIASDSSEQLRTVFKMESMLFEAIHYRLGAPRRHID